MDQNLCEMGFRALPLPLAQLSLAAVLKCGQSFRWSALPLVVPNAKPSVPTHEYRLCLRDRVVCLQQDEHTLWYRAALAQAPKSADEQALRDTETLAWVRDYFQLDVDLEALYDDWSRRDPVFARLRNRFGGIRMLRQDPWENLVSFICSSNNHISRITSMVSKLCKHYSPALLSLPVPDGADAETYHAFPPPSVLADPAVSTTLRGLGFGYRADFIQRTALMLVDAHGTERDTKSAREAAETWLLTLRDMDTTAARDELVKFVGVGRKVADCVLLMSMDKAQVIPVDTHVQQIAVKHYGFRKGASGGKVNMTPQLYSDVNEKLAAIWGPYAGWAHSVLFTADLKSFASYGLATPLSSPEKPKLEPTMHDDLLPLATPPSTKRKRAARTQSAVDVHVEVDELPQVTGKLEEVDLGDTAEAGTLAERVKRRRRVLTRSKTDV